MTTTFKQVAAALLSAALVLAIILAISPHATVATNAVSGEVYGIDILGITKNSKDLPDQQFAAF